MGVVPSNSRYGLAMGAPKPRSFLLRLALALDSLAVDQMQHAVPGPRHAVQGAAPSQKKRRVRDRNINCMLNLSESRASDTALEILGGYKLTGNFPVDLEIVLKDLAVLDKLTYEIKPKPPLSDSQHVVFWPNDDVHADRFSEIMRSINRRIGYDASPPWWQRLFR